MSIVSIHSPAKTLVVEVGFGSKSLQNIDIIDKPEVTNPDNREDSAISDTLERILAQILAQR